MYSLCVEPKTEYVLYIWIHWYRYCRVSLLFFIIHTHSTILLTYFWLLLFCVFGCSRTYWIHSVVPWKQNTVRSIFSWFCIPTLASSPVWNVMPYLFFQFWAHFYLVWAYIYLFVCFDFCWWFVLSKFDNIHYTFGAFDWKNMKMNIFNWWTHLEIVYWI